MKNKPELVSFSEMLMLGPFYDQRQFFAPEIEHIKSGLDGLLQSGLIKESENELIEYNGSIAIISIEGPMRPGRGWYFSTGYGDIQDAIVELIDSDVTTVIQRLKTPGGTVNQAFETEEMFYELAKEKRLVSLIEMATSAGSLLSFPAHERYLTSKTAQTGSIGVVAEHVDNRIWYKEFLGEIRTSVASGKMKDAGTDTRGFDEKAKEVFESSVKKLKSIFVDSAAKGLNRSSESIEAQESRVFIGQEGIDNGFADGFKTLNELIEENNSISPPERPAFYKIQNEGNSMDINQLKAEHQDVYKAVLEQGRREGMEAGKEKYIAEGEAKGALLERKRISDIKALALPGQEELTEKMINEGTEPGEAASKYLSDQKAKLQNQNNAIETELQDSLESDSPDMPEEPKEEAKDPMVEFETKVKKKVDSGMKRTDAIKAVAKGNPELHQSYIKAIQGGK